MESLLWLSHGYCHEQKALTCLFCIPTVATHFPLAIFLVAVHCTNRTPSVFSVWATDGFQAVGSKLLLVRGTESPLFPSLPRGLQLCDESGLFGPLLLIWTYPIPPPAHFPVGEERLAGAELAYLDHLTRLGSTRHWRIPFLDCRHIPVLCTAHFCQSAQRGAISWTEGRQILQQDASEVSLVPFHSLPWVKWIVSVVIKHEIQLVSSSQPKSRDREGPLW